ncbi:MAG: molybdenum cofactor biosynthesis protein MoaE [Acidimicrobiales bacterium]
MGESRHMHLHDEHCDAHVDDDVGEDWIVITGDPLAIDDVIQWAILPSCGAVASFLGVTRKESSVKPGQKDVVALDYEAYEQPALDRMRQIASYARERWPDLGRIAILHRTGGVGLCEPSVLIVASSPHRSAALSAVSYIIDAVKSSVPVWKKEHFDLEVSDHAILGAGQQGREQAGGGQSGQEQARKALLSQVEAGPEQTGGGQSRAVSAWAAAHSLEDIPRPPEGPAPQEGPVPRVTQTPLDGSPSQERPTSCDTWS